MGLEDLATIAAIDESSSDFATLPTYLVVACSLPGGYRRKFPKEPPKVFSSLDRWQLLIGMIRMQPDSTRRYWPQWADQIVELVNATQAEVVQRGNQRIATLYVDGGGTGGKIARRFEGSPLSVVPSPKTKQHHYKTGLPEHAVNLLELTDWLARYAMRNEGHFESVDVALVPGVVQFLPAFESRVPVLQGVNAGSNLYK